MVNWLPSQVQGLGRYKGSPKNQLLVPSDLSRFSESSPTVPQPLERIATAIGDFSGATFRQPASVGPFGHPSSELQELTAKAVELALQNLWNGGVLVPVVAWTGSDGLCQHRSFGDHTRLDTDLDLGLQGARATVDAFNPEEVARYVWVYDGYAGRNHHESVIVEAAERGCSYGWLLAARYRLSKRGITLVDQEMLEVATVRTPLSA